MCVLSKLTFSIATMSKVTEKMPTSNHNATQIDGPVEALHRLTQSANDFLRYQQDYANSIAMSEKLMHQEEELKKKDKRIQELELAWGIMIQQVQKEIDQLVREKKLLEEEKNAAVKKLERHHSESYGKLQQEMAETEAKLQRSLEDNGSLNTRLSMAQKKIQGLTSYTTSFSSLDETRFAKDLMNIWTKVDDIVKFFSLNVDVSPDTHDKWKQNLSSFIMVPRSLIRIPSTNSPAAKFARKAAMLNVFSFTLSHFIFTATPWAVSLVGLDEVLMDLAESDHKKEAQCRAILLTSKIKNLRQEKEIQRVGTWIQEHLGALFPTKTKKEFGEKVNALLGSAAKCWNQTRLNPQKIVSSLDFESGLGSWKDYPMAKDKHKQNGHPVGPEKDAGDVSFIAFPTIVMQRGGTWTTLHDGLLIRECHLEEADAELVREDKARRFSKTGIPHDQSDLPLMHTIVGVVETIKASVD